MALTQIQIIQSLGEAMNWLERELSWGVADVCFCKMALDQNVPEVIEKQTMKKR